MASQRFDLVLRYLDGPWAGHEVVLQGPVIELGTAPSPGGMVVQGHGIAPIHARLSCYGADQVSLAPVGSNPVRMAAQPGVDWERIPPIQGNAFIGRGTLIHLGRGGATVQFVEAVPLGAWQGEAISGVGTGHKVQTVLPWRPSVALLGCLFAGTLLPTTAIAAFLVFRPTDPEPIGPMDGGEVRYRSLTFEDVSEYTPSDQALVGIEHAFAKFVGRPNRDQAAAYGSQHSDLAADRDTWDKVYLKWVTASVEQHVRSKAFFRRLDQVKELYHDTLADLREAQLPEVYAAMPYQESLYDPDAQSWVCAKGIWQLMPEVAYRLEVDQGIPVTVRDCPIIKKESKLPGVWSPSTKVPPAGVSRGNGPYVMFDAQGEVVCTIPEKNGCRIDGRRDPDLATQGAIVLLGEAYHDEVIGRSGAAVQLAMISHNAGFDASRFGNYSRKTNIKPAFLAWSADRDPSEHHLFYGENIKCAPSLGVDRCGAAIPAQTQHYAYAITATHILAACYYGKNYPGMPAFQGWDSMFEAEGVCKAYSIPPAPR